MKTNYNLSKAIKINKWFIIPLSALVFLAFSCKDKNLEEIKEPVKTDKIFKETEVEAQFPGGREKWAKYIQSAIVENINEFGEEDFGTCVVKFIVDENGKVSNVEATTMKGTNLARTSVDAIRKGPDWIPAMQNGYSVKAFRLQPVTLTNPDK